MVYENDIIHQVNFTIIFDTMNGIHLNKALDVLGHEQLGKTIYE
jgi:hypothetical protein